MSKTVVLYTAEMDDSQPVTRHCGLKIEAGEGGPTVIAWVDDQGVELHLTPANACRNALELLRQALHADYNVALDDAARRAMLMMAAAGDIARDKQTHDRPDDPPRGVHAH